MPTLRQRFAQFLLHHRNLDISSNTVDQCCRGSLSALVKLPLVGMGRNASERQNSWSLVISQQQA